MADITKEAIDRIVKLADQARAIDWSKVDKDDVQGILVEDGVKLVDLEPYFFGRRRYRGTFDTFSVKAFARYVSDAGAPAPCFIDQDGLAATHFADLGDRAAPGHCVDRATLKLRMTALYRAILEVDGKAMSQQELAEWLEDWKAYLFDPTDVRAAIRAVRCIDIKKTAEATSIVGDFRDTQSRLATIEVSSKDELPEVFVFRCKPCDELTERDIVLRMSAIAGDRPALKLRIVSRGALTEDIANEFANLLSVELPNAATPLIGKFAP